MGNVVGHPRFAAGNNSDLKIVTLPVPNWVLRRLRWIHDECVEAGLARAGQEGGAGCGTLLTMAIVAGCWNDGRRCKMGQWTMPGKGPKRGSGEKRPALNRTVWLTPSEYDGLRHFAREACIGGAAAGKGRVAALRTAMMSGLNWGGGWEEGWIDEPPADEEKYWQGFDPCEWFVVCSILTGVCKGPVWEVHGITAYENWFADGLSSDELFERIEDWRDNRSIQVCGSGAVRYKDSILRLAIEYMMVVERAA